ncbi:reverse transcriptase domain, reverse transcriptase zinc-binding domain protein [Tanacetum coccineum]
MLSSGGRLTLIKSVLGSLGLYYMSIFKAPDAVIKALESICASFFWGASGDKRKLAWIKWSNILASLDKGGLGVGSLKAFNYSLLLKWRWRMYNRLFRLERNQNCLIRDRIANGSWSWDWSRPMLFGRTQADFNNLLIDISSLDIDVGRDTPIFTLFTDNIYSVSVARKYLDDCMLPSSLPCTRWYKVLPRKVNIFMWQLFLDRLPHRLNLSSQGLDIDSITCPVCNGFVESNSHVFLFLRFSF